MCQKTGITGNKTNHSLRATGATNLFEKGVPEKIIQERTGHRSIEALRVYGHTNVRQHQMVSSLLSARPTEYSPYDMYPNSMKQQSYVSAASHISSTSQCQDNIFPGIQFNGNLLLYSKREREQLKGMLLGR